MFYLLEMMPIGVHWEPAKSLLGELARDSLEALEHSSFSLQVTLRCLLFRLQGKEHTSKVWVKKNRQA